MSQGFTTRRDFVKQGIGAALAAGMASAPAMAGETPAADRMPQANPNAAPAAGTHAIRLGGKIFVKTEDPEEMARAHRALGYRAAYCPNIPLNESARIDAAASAYAKHDVVIAEVGRWVNLMDADAEKRRANLQTVTDGLALAEAVGARCCVDIAGSYNREFWFGPHPDNLSPQFFEAAVENARKIIDAVKPKRARFCYEMMGWAIPDSSDSYLRLIKAVDRPAFGVHLDPCNLVNSPERFYRNTELLNECFDKLGPHIVSCHAKDLTWDVEMNVHFREVPPGKGSMDYKTWLRRLATLPGDVPLMIEHCKDEAEYESGRKHIQALASKIGLNAG